ncbi:MAG: hypothetical protein AAF988_08710 [Pseudomonadota bacterium]
MFKAFLIATSLTQPAGPAADDISTAVFDSAESSSIVLATARDTGLSGRSGGHNSDWEAPARRAIQTLEGTCNGLKNGVFLDLSHAQGLAARDNQSMFEHIGKPGEPSRRKVIEACKKVGVKGIPRRNF